MDEAKAAEVLGRVKASADMEDLRGCDMIIEAVFEKIEVKDKVIAETEEYLVENGVWGSNASTLPITRLGSTRPEELCGSALLLAGRQDATAGNHRGCGNPTLARAFDFAQQLRKTPSSSVTRRSTLRTIGTKIIEGVQLVAEGDPLRVDNLSP